MALAKREVKAAGGVVLRERAGGGVEVLVVHRPRYDDWSLPKGKLERGESFETAAVREVLEETGFRCRLLRELDPVRYEDHKGRTKIVRYWLMDPREEHPFTPNDEVDALEWLELHAAAQRLSYEHDQELIAGLAAGGPGA